MTTTVTADPDWDGTWDEAYVEEDLNDETNYYTANDEMDFTDETYLEVEQNFEEAYATYLDARRQMAHLKASRGFFPVVALTAEGSMAGTPTSKSPKTPKSKGRGKFKPKGKGKNKTSTWVTKGGQIPQRANATRCLKCGQVGHWAASCPQSGTTRSSPTSRQSPTSTPTSSPSKKAKTDGSAMMVRDMAKLGPRGVPHLGPQGWYGIQDGGASSVVCGHETLMKIIDYMRGRGVQPERFLLHADQQDFWFWR